MSNRQGANADRVVCDGALRSAAWRDRRKAEGLTTVTVLVPLAAAADMQVLAGRLRDERALRVDVIRDSKTGRFVSLHKTRRRPVESGQPSAITTGCGSSDAEPIIHG